MIDESNLSKVCIIGSNGSKIELCGTPEVIFNGSFPVFQEELVRFISVFVKTLISVSCCKGLLNIFGHFSFIGCHLYYLKKDFIKNQHTFLNTLQKLRHYILYLV